MVKSCFKKLTNGGSRVVPSCSTSKVGQVISSCENYSLITCFIFQTKSDVISTKNFMKNLLEFGKTMSDSFFKNRGIDPKIGFSAKPSFSDFSRFDTARVIKMKYLKICPFESPPSKLGRSCRVTKTRKRGGI